LPQLAAAPAPSDEIALLRSTSVTDAVKRELMRMILAGELDAGEKIGEAALAARLGVGRSNIREAFRGLEESGLVVSEKNRGAYVRVHSDGEARELYEVRAGLDDLAARLLAPGIAAEAIGELRRRVAALDALCRKRERFRDYYEQNLAFHDRIVELANNRTLLAIYRRVIDQMHLLRRRGLLRGGSLEVSNREHAGIVDALASRDAERAARACREHTLAGFARMRGEATRAMGPR
jgi:DNA-binding GntR family transcriptional regulator